MAEVDILIEIKVIEKTSLSSIFCTVYLDKVDWILYQFLHFSEAIDSNNISTPFT